MNHVVLRRLSGANKARKHTLHGCICMFFIVVYIIHHTAACLKPMKAKADNDVADIII